MSSQIQNPDQDLIDQVLVRVCSGQSIEQAVMAVGSMDCKRTPKTMQAI